MLKVGAGNCLVSVAFEILPSFLPFGTFQVGPPDLRKACKKHSIAKFKLLNQYQIVLYDNYD